MNKKILNWTCAIFILFFFSRVSFSEVILQYFNTPWADITKKMPELAEAGYTALWLPPPFKAGAGRYSVGFDTTDQFDLGSKDQNGSIATKYGTEEELLELIRVAHRFGLRIYFDNVMAHRAVSLDADSLAELGFVPEDFHVLKKPDGTFANMPTSVDYSDEWQVLYRNPFAIDMALEDEGDDMNRSFGSAEGDWFPKYEGIRHPDNTEYYLDTDLAVATNYDGSAVYTFANQESFEDLGLDGEADTDDTGEDDGVFSWSDDDGDGQHDAGESCEPFDDVGLFPDNTNKTFGVGDGIYNMGNPVAEDVNAMLIRGVRWFLDKSHADGFRLDAVKHVPHYFFGKTSGSDKDYSNWGYCGGIQEQFNITHGYSDWDNHRDTTFNDSQARDDALLYGEHLGSQSGWSYQEDDYLDAGTRIANDNFLNAVKGNVGYTLGNSLDLSSYALYGGSAAQNVIYVMSHDNNYIYGGDNGYEGNRSEAHALLLIRQGIPIVYTDGNNQAGEPDWFPKPAYVPFLGQFGYDYIMNSLDIRRHFVRGDQIGKWSSTDLVAYEFRDKSEDESMSDADGTLMLFAMARWGSGGESCDSFSTTFPVGSLLKNYSYHGGEFYAQVNSSGVIKALDGSTIFAPDHGWFAFSWRIPEMPAVWDDGLTGEVQAITILQNGEAVSSMTYTRSDGKDGDPAFNPYGLSDDDTTDYAYDMTIPLVTSGTNLSFIARADGSAKNILMKLDGGVDINSHMGLGSLSDELRDNPPALSTDAFLGYESMSFQHRVVEKFAAEDVSRNCIGSLGSESYEMTIGASGVAVNHGSGVNASDDTATWVYHDPEGVNESGDLQFDPPPESATDSNITVWVKIGYQFEADRAFLYYTTNGAEYPEGSVGQGKSDTDVIELSWNSNGAHDGTGTPDWWVGTLPAMEDGTVLRYKIGVLQTNAASLFPSSTNNIAVIERMETVYAITNFNAETVSYYPHIDYGDMDVGLDEGLHVLRIKSFLERDGRASIFKESLQAFYYDVSLPQGEILYPSSDGETHTGSSYEYVVRADDSVTKVIYRINDSSDENNDSVLGVTSGNGDWAEAIELTPTEGLASDYENEFRFDYINIPTSGTATIEVRLMEYTSSTNMSLSDEEGHYTTLTRSVNTEGPAIQLYIAWPQYDGETVGEGYVLKANFTKLLLDDASETEMLNNLTLEIDGEVQAHDDYSISYDETANHHALAFTLPNLYDGLPYNPHELSVTFSRSGMPELVSTRLVYATVAETPYVAFTNPPATDESGDIYELVLSEKETVTIDDRTANVAVESTLAASNLWVDFSSGTGVITAAAYNPTNNGSYKLWDFSWTFPTNNDADEIEGSYTLEAYLDTDGNTNTVEATAKRTVYVILRETVDEDDDDVDDDDDGIADTNETTSAGFPEADSTEWTNDDVHVYYSFGKTSATSPDSDGDNLPDALELGFRQATTNTDSEADTDGDGFNNFIADLDPPFYNTEDNYGLVPGVSDPGTGSKADLVSGSTTDPNDADSDNDGLSDGVEDANRNGWVDGDGESLPADWYPWLDRDWPDEVWDELWTETDPNNPDTDGDGLSDGYGEDKNYDGLIEGDTNTNRVYDSGEAWSETNPLRDDTDGDGLPDGWETGYGLDPLDDGTNSWQTTDADDGDPDNGAGGDPDGDEAVNLAEWVSGTNPRWSNSVSSVTTSNSIVIGLSTTTTVGSVVNTHTFTDWICEDLIALDGYDSDPYADDDLQTTLQSNGGDLYYRWWDADGYESSRDIVAFYARDGGDDGLIYFRVDFHDLEAYAEENGLDIYVVVDTGNTDIGESVIVDNVDAVTEMKWEVTVAIYDGYNANVYVNTPGSDDTDSIEDALTYSSSDVQTRGRSHADGVREIYFDSHLDSVEFSVSREALIDAGWIGDFDALNFQVFTTRDGTDGGEGELDGPDIQDVIRSNGGITEDYAGEDDESERYEARIELTTLNEWVGVNADNDRGHCVKVMMLVHGNQHVQPGSAIQDLINNDAGSGYYRALDTHEAFDVPLTMHVSPTLAMAMQWAKVDPSVEKSWLDGPTFNQRIHTLAETGIVDMVAATLSDHMLPYFTEEFNSNNVALAREVLENIYGHAAISEDVFWTPERLVDDDVLSKVANLGYGFTFIDQMQHLVNWVSYSKALSDGYYLHEFNGVKCFVINDLLEDYRFSVHDYGPSMVLREILSTQARSSAWDGQLPRVITLLYDWEEFDNDTYADAYDLLIRWLANKRWVQLVTADQIAADTLDISTPPDGVSDAWNSVGQGSGLELNKVAKNWVHHASQQDYDNWYLGSTYNQGLNDYAFEIRDGVSVPQNYGMLYTTGLIKDAWDSVSSLSNPTSSLGKLARLTLHASVFETAFHKQTSDNSLAKHTTGDYAWPDEDYDVLADFTRYAQSQSRMAAIYERVDDWAASPASTPTTGVEDVDLDGEDEYLLYSDRLFALFERIGGRLVGVWVRDILSGDVYQAAGNMISYSGSETEDEGSYSVETNGTVVAYRTSLLKDWYATKSGGTVTYNNDLYTFTDRTNGWRIVSSDTNIQKTVTLSSGTLDVEYQLLNGMAGETLYVRHGFSPNLYDLLLNGQETLGDLNVSGGVMTLANTNYGETVVTTLGYQDSGHNALLNTNAVDDDPSQGIEFYTLNMRNQAQTHQVEIYGTNTFSFALSFRAYPSDWDGDEMPNSFEDNYSLDAENSADGSNDDDGDGVVNADEYISNTSPNDGTDYLHAASIQATNGSGIIVRFPTELVREYFISYTDGSLISPTWQSVNTNGLDGTGGVYQWLDDGALTAPHPFSATNRNYRIGVALPQ